MSFFADPNSIPEHNGFPLFGAIHLSWLFIITILTFLLIYHYRHLSQQGKRHLERTVCWTMVLTDMFRYISLLAIGCINANYLPLHLCGLSIYLALWNFYYPHPLKEELLFCLTLPGTTFALLFPNWTTVPFGHFIHITSFIIHAGLLVYPIMLLNNGRFRPNYRRLPQCFFYFSIVLIPIYFFNRLFQTNYMFLSWPAPGSPLILLARWFGNPGYLFGAFLLLLLVWLMMYTIAYLIYKRKDNLATNAQKNCK